MTRRVVRKTTSIGSLSHRTGAAARGSAAGGAPHILPDELLALFRAKDLDTLIDGTFKVLEAAVECDYVSTFYRSGGNGLLKERDSLGRKYAPAFMRRYAELTPAIPLVLANRGIKILPTRTGLPGPISKLRRTAFYREIMRPQGW
jgi:hypothetical protein